jgi:hypothetical protein
VVLYEEEHVTASFLTQMEVQLDVQGFSDHSVGSTLGVLYNISVSTRGDSAAVGGTLAGAVALTVSGVSYADSLTVLGEVLSNLGVSVRAEDSVSGQLSNVGALAVVTSGEDRLTAASAAAIGLAVEASYSESLTVDMQVLLAGLSLTCSLYEEESVQSALEVETVPVVPESPSGGSGGRQRRRERVARVFNKVQRREVISDEELRQLIEAIKSVDAASVGVDRLLVEATSLYEEGVKQRRSQHQQQQRQQDTEELARLLQEEAETQKQVEEVFKRLTKKKSNFTRAKALLLVN